MTRIALAAGGTAGHIYPAIAVAEELAKHGVDVVFAGTRFGHERELIGDRLRILPGSPFHRTTFGGRVRALLTIVPAILAARRMLRGERIDGVIGFGGFASIGPVLAARTLGLWAAIVEPNAVPGMANRLLARFADRIYTGALAQFGSPKTRRVGLPVRTAIRDAAARRKSNPEPRVLLLDPQLAVPAGTKVIEISCDIAPAFAAAGVVVSRGGAGAMAEAAVCGVPMIIVPLPDAAENHQSRNAKVYADAGAAIVVDEHDWRNGAAVAQLLADEPARRQLAQRIRTFAMPNAARDLADDALTSAAGAPPC